MKLFYSPGACSLAPIIISEWLGFKLDMQKVDSKAPPDFFLRVNPLGSVPVLQMNNGGMDRMKDDHYVQKALLRESA